MKDLTRPVMLAAALLAASGTTAARPLETEDLFRARRISSPALSPDGRSVVFTLATPIPAENRTETDLWTVPSAGGEPRQLTARAGTDGSAAWSPDGRWIAFVSSRSGEQQIWMLPAGGGDPWQFTRLSTGATSPVWSPDGRAVAFVSEVAPEFSARPFGEADSLNRKKLEGALANPVKARVFNSLYYRHWNSWSEGRRAHIFLQSFGGPHHQAEPRNLTPGERDAVPRSSTFSGGIDFGFSPDGKELAYTATPVPVREQAWRTNHDIYTVSTEGGEPRAVAPGPGAEGTPRYSPDGRFIAYRAQAREGYEADRRRMMLYERSTGRSRCLTGNFEESVGTPVWSPDGTGIIFDAESRGRVSLYAVTLKGNDVREIAGGGTLHDVIPFPDGKRILYTGQSAVRPVELFTMPAGGGEPLPITHMNDSLFAHIEIPPPLEFTYPGEGGTPVHCWIHTPPEMKPGRKYPLVLFVHGGPQGAWTDGWHYRWNPALWAAQGYVVAAPNPRGSTGFGERFKEEISGDWGGRVFTDLLKGLDALCALPYVDSTRKAAAGASFGGFMMSWFQGTIGERFRTLVTHAGTYNFESMYGTTEEIWFDEWDHRGPPWAHPEEFLRFSPHRLAGNFRTPNLITHGELDFRVPYSEAMQLFTALQRQGVPSRLVLFPDEGHWILRPANSAFWHRTVFEWLRDYLGT
ncbi:MAG: S9 family peptidase [Bacteroidota bacterium]